MKELERNLNNPPCIPFQEGFTDPASLVWKPPTLEQMRERVGNTPVVLLDQIGGSILYAKIESENPTESIKARTAYAMLQNALVAGSIGPEGVVISSGGNFALALACMCQAESIPLTVSLLSSAPSTYQEILTELGARVLVESDTRNDRREIALELSQQGYCFLDQHNSPVALAAIEQTLAPEIIAQTRGELTDVVAGFGTGMTVFGLSKYLSQNMRASRRVRIAAVEDDISLLDFHWRSLSVANKQEEEKLRFLQTYQAKSGRPMRVYRTKDGSIGSVLFYVGDRAQDDIPGIGISGLQPFVEKLIQTYPIDNVLQIKPQDARQATRWLHKQGIFVGISSGATYLAARTIFEECVARNEQCCVVAIFADGASLYKETLYGKSNRD